MLTDEQTVFLRAILSGDRDAALIFADWLDERDEPGDGELAAALRTTRHPRSLALQAVGPMRPNSPDQIAWVIRERLNSNCYADHKEADALVARWREAFQCGAREIRVVHVTGDDPRIAVYDGWVRFDAPRLRASPLITGL
ncbi:MAG TPA: hypothetical protein VGE52_09390 [Pirellulales bacterium]